MIINGKFTSTWLGYITELGLRRFTFFLNLNSQCINYEVSMFVFIGKIYAHNKFYWLKYTNISNELL